MKQALSRSWIVLAVACSGAVLADCGQENHGSIAENQVSAKDLQGKWVLESIAGKAVEEGPEIYFAIDERTITGFDGCNTFGGSIDAPENLRMTQRACAEEGPRLPLELSDPRPQLESSRLDGDVLEMDLPGGAGKARFRKKTES